MVFFYATELSITVYMLAAGTVCGAAICSVVESELEPQNPQLFVLAEPEPQCISVPIPAPELDFDPDST